MKEWFRQYTRHINWNNPLNVISYTLLLILYVAMLIGIIYVNL